MSLKDGNIDYLAEIVVSHMVANNKFDYDHLVIHMKGVFKRFFSKDFEKYIDRRNIDGEKECNIFLHREGIYDTLPEALFLSYSGQFFKDKEETIAEFRKHDAEEASARLFFKPIEQEYFKLRIHKEIFEQNFFYTPQGIEEFIDFFNLNSLELTDYQKSAMFFILPHIPKIAGNLDLIQTCFEIFIHEQVQITLDFCDEEIIGIGLNAQLNKSILGINSVLGEKLTDCRPMIKVEIGPLYNAENLHSFLFGNKKLVLDRLAELFFQADLDIKTEVLLEKEDGVFKFEEKQYDSILNYSTTI